VVAAGGPREVQPTGLYVTGHRVGHDPMILGAVPDGIASLRLRLANGATRHVPVVDNTYRASVPSRVVGIEVTSADGVRTSAPVASPKRHGHGKHKPRKRKPRKRR
jgi:KaiC/GvpD/RAD55 family RecA-like ATPase